MICVVADPPWRFGDALPGATRGASKNYQCMHVDDICNMPLPQEIGAAPDAVLFLWRVSSMQEEALRVARSWDFTVKAELVWLKRTVGGKRWFGMGRYVRMEHETCLICVRGRAFPELRNARSTFEAKASTHSRKPDEFFRIVESLYPHADKYELFARVIRRGWHQHGNELGSLGCEQP